jgi:SAM-dependent methyltransferase
MEWAKEFYTKQVLWGGWPAGWAAHSLSTLLAAVQRHPAAVARLAGAGPQRILELGAGPSFTAAALAAGGHSVVAVELVPECLANLRRLAAEVRREDLRVVEGDFYQLTLPEPFDVVCSFDGFGIGADAEQRRLLQRMAGWLTPGGCALIDILTPWYWAAMEQKPRESERSWQTGQARGRWDFDPEGCRMVGPMWHVDDESHVVTQSIRCYAPADLRLLLEGTGLSLQALEGYESERYDHAVPLAQAMLYLAQLVPVAGSGPVAREQG